MWDHPRPRPSWYIQQLVTHSPHCLTETWDEDETVCLQELLSQTHRQNQWTITDISTTRFSLKYTSELTKLQQFCKRKGNVDLYSASSQTPLTRSDMDHTVLPANNTISAFTRKRSQAAPPCIYAERTPELNLLLIYRPQEDEWLSWPWWLVRVRWISRSGSWTPIRSPIPVLTGPGVE